MRISDWSSDVCSSDLAESLGAPLLKIVAGEAPSALAGLEAPDAVFIGGGASNAGLIDACWSALRPGGRLVVNAVTLEGEAALQIGRAAGRERVCQYVEISVVALP